MNDGFGNPIYIFNPFTYDDLHKMVGPPGTIDKYLLCISELQAPIEGEVPTEICEKPLVPEIDEQGVGIIPVIERCRSNYQQHQWDAGAFMLYDTENLGKALRIPAIVPTMDEDDSVGQCLVQANRNKESNGDCLSEHLRNNYIDASDSAKFWRYEKADPIKAATVPSDQIDACVVFSGPAKREDNSSTTLEFRRCSHDFTDTGCMIPQMVWSSSSSNKVHFMKCLFFFAINPVIIDKEPAKLSNHH